MVVYEAAGSKRIVDTSTQAEDRVLEDPVFTERELDIMSLLWSEGTGSVAEVRSALGDSVAYTTILKLLQILEELEDSEFF